MLARPETNKAMAVAVNGLSLGYTINYKAGLNDYYMYTNYRQFSASPYNLESVLQQNNCATRCPFSIGINLTAASMGTANFDINQSISDSSQHNFYADTLSDTINFNPSQINAFFTDINGTKYESKNVQFQNGYFKFSERRPCLSHSSTICSGHLFRKSSAYKT